MPGPPPKDPKLRQRRNKDATAGTFIDTSPIAEGDIPELPERDDGVEWHPRAVRLWDEIWTAPMASEYTLADVHRVELYVDLFHRCKVQYSAAAMAELRLQGVCLGVTPIDRRRLQWEIKRVEKPGEVERPKIPERVADPRAALRAIK